MSSFLLGSLRRSVDLIFSTFPLQIVAAVGGTEAAATTTAEAVETAAATAVVTEVAAATATTCPAQVTVTGKFLFFLSLCSLLYK